MKRRRWTEAEDALLRATYPHERTDDLAKRLGRSLTTTYQRAYRLGLEKTAAYLASPAARRLDGVRGASTRFKPGQPSWNKGTHFTAGGRSAETRFKPGQRPHTWRPIGSERVMDGYLQRKVTDTGYTPRDWKGVHTLNWEAVHGLVPPRHALACRDGNKQNVAPENWELVTRAELMRRNTIHRYPKEIALAVQLRGALVRKINRMTKEPEA